VVGDVGCFVPVYGWSDGWTVVRATDKASYRQRVDAFLRDPKVIKSMCLWPTDDNQLAMIRSNATMNWTGPEGAMQSSHFIVMDEHGKSRAFARFYILEENGPPMIGGMLFPGGARLSDVELRWHLIDFLLYVFAEGQVLKVADMSW